MTAAARFAFLLLTVTLLASSLGAMAAVPTKRPVYLFSSKTKRMLQRPQVQRPQAKPTRLAIRWIFEQK